MHVDIHQHLWPDGLVGELRRRSRPPRLDGWTLLTAGEPPFAVHPADHDAGARAEQAARDGIGLAVIGLSGPLGIEYLQPEDAQPLLDAHHDGIAASVHAIRPGGADSPLDWRLAGGTWRGLAPCGSGSLGRSRSGRASRAPGVR